MKRKYVILGSIFVFFLVLGIWINCRKGMNLMSDFWVLEKDGSFNHLDNKILCLDKEHGNRFEVTFGETSFTATIELLEDGWYMETNEGWAMKRSSENNISVMAGETLWMGDAQITIHDPSAMGLYFEAAREEQKNYIYGTDNTCIGESYDLISESGQTISYREVWYDNPEQNTPKQPVEVIKAGITLSSENYQNTLYVNEKGEYLLNPDSLFMIPSGDGYISRSGLVRALVQIAESEVEQRGHLSFVVLYIIFYALGAATLLWPEKMAFLGHRWRYYSEPELSDAGLMMELIGGVIIIVMSVILLFQPLVG